ncbi:kinase-like protein [Basidiobolus meristosporus CBS 931.73]|uniref:non-specific serine/threonine protein kinase n=1 Tax=Basidiobolus meristosporus CBS 931.73 TaxID=1314790 RepID=A0A1Y1YIT8_9FUNG|nr:kinase-like protein [Basidiobolus meristosporus CBS 931.73]|eukprot:ORX97930.1 kinase-like protein [Basidiobolus meristosporus CBS 931.73]
MTTQGHSGLVKTSTSSQCSNGVLSTTTSSISDKTTPQSPNSYVEEYWTQPTPSALTTPRKEETSFAISTPTSLNSEGFPTPNSEPARRHSSMEDHSPTHSASSTPIRNPTSQLKVNLFPMHSGNARSYSDSPVSGSSGYPHSPEAHRPSISSVHSFSSGDRHKHKTRGEFTDNDVLETSKITVEYDPTTGNKIINNYMIIKELGRGCHGKVKLCRDIETGVLYAIKIVEKFSRRRLGQRQDQSSSLNKIRKEIAILKKCHHPHVVRLHEVIDDPEAKKIYLVLEYVDGGEMRWRDEDDQPVLSLSTSRHIFRDVVLGLEYLHHQGIIHRDIKPANLLRTRSGVVKITDFGVSYFSRNRNSQAFQPHLHMDNGRNSISHIRKDSRSSTSLQSINEYESTDSFHASQNSVNETDELELAKTAGSPAFFAPELCFPGEEYLDIPAPDHQSPSTEPDTMMDRRGSRASLLKPPITKAIDIWALGVTLYCLVFGRCPFMAETEYELFHLIPKKPLEFPDDVPIPDTLKDLLLRLLEKDPLQRMTLEETKRHPWVIEDLANPEQWYHDTDPCNYEPLKVTEEDVKKAVTFKDRLRKHIRKLSSSLSHMGASLGFRRKSKSGFE